MSGQTLQKRDGSGTNLRRRGPEGPPTGASCKAVENRDGNAHDDGDAHGDGEGREDIPDDDVGASLTVVDGGLVVAGELDLRSVDAVRHALRALADDVTPAEVRLDLAGVTFIDSTTVGVLVVTARQLAARGQRLVVARRSPAVERVLDVLGLSQHFAPGS